MWELGPQAWPAAFLAQQRSRVGCSSLLYISVSLCLGSRSQISSLPPPPHMALFLGYPSGCPPSLLCEEGMAYLPGAMSFQGWKLALQSIGRVTVENEGEKRLPCPNLLKLWL